MYSWPSLGATLFIAAGWGILRYLHFIRPRSIAAGVFAAVALAVALTMTVSTTLRSPESAANKLKHAAVRGTELRTSASVRSGRASFPPCPRNELTEKPSVLRAGEP